MGWLDRICLKIEGDDSSGAIGAATDVLNCERCYFFNRELQRQNEADRQPAPTAGTVNGLEVDEPQPEPEQPEQPEMYEPEPEPEPKSSGLGFSPFAKKIDVKTSRLGGELGRFIGEYDRECFSIVIRGDKGAGKSRLLYQLINLFAYKHLNIGFYSLEMSQHSSVTNSYKEEYITPENIGRIDISTEPPTFKELNEACKHYDVIAIDSWTKLKNVEQGDFDRLQKLNPQTILLVVFQSTTGRVTRGGNMPEYDGGIVIHVHKGGLAECEKNRYAATDRLYDVFNRCLIDRE